MRLDEVRGGSGPAERAQLGPEPGGPSAVGTLPDAVAGLLGDPAYAAAARAVADAMAELPPVADAVALLERLARG